MFDCKLKLYLKHSLHKNIVQQDNAKYRTGGKYLNGGIKRRKRVSVRDEERQKKGTKRRDEDRE